jgi:hypothetical protein
MCLSKQNPRALPEEHQSDSKCTQRPASQSESSSGDGGNVAVGLSVSGGSGSCRATNVGRVAGARAQAVSQLACNSIPLAWCKKNEKAVIVLDASAAVDWMLQTLAELAAEACAIGLFCVR